MTTFVDALAHIGLGLDKLLRAPLPQDRKTGPKVGTMGWIKKASNDRRQPKNSNSI
jgi:hypothetical protein